MKYLLTILLSLVATVSAMAETVKTYVIVEFKSGETLALALEANPKASFADNTLVLTATDFESTYQIADIHRFYFSELPEGVKTLEAADKKSAGVIYDTAGRKVASYAGSINATSLPTGSYIVKTESGHTFKVTKK